VIYSSIRDCCTWASGDGRAGGGGAGPSRSKSVDVVLKRFDIRLGFRGFGGLVRLVIVGIWGGD
jgi:hypothetical protein